MPGFERQGQQVAFCKIIKTEVQPPVGRDLYYVDMYWSGDNKWYAGEITALNDSESGKQFEVFYESDGEKW